LDVRCLCRAKAAKGDLDVIAQALAAWARDSLSKFAHEAARADRCSALRIVVAALAGAAARASCGQLVRGETAATRLILRRLDTVLLQRAHSLGDDAKGLPRALSEWAEESAREVSRVQGAEFEVRREVLGVLALVLWPDDQPEVCP
jgi:hypothetical protein